MKLLSIFRTSNVQSYKIFPLKTPDRRIPVTTNSWINFIPALLALLLRLTIICYCILCSFPLIQTSSTWSNYREEQEKDISSPTSWFLCLLTSNILTPTIPGWSQIWKINQGIRERSQSQHASNFPTIEQTYNRHPDTQLN